LRILKPFYLLIRWLWLVNTDKVLGVNAANRFFKGFDFTQTARTAFTGSALDTSKNQIIDPLLPGLMNTSLSTQPDEADVKDLLSSVDTQNLNNDPAPAADVYDYESLISTMLQCTSCDTTKRTEEIVIATCASALGSALTVIQ